MTDEQIMQVAKRLNMDILRYYDQESGCTPADFIKFANEIARIEREECAKVADKLSNMYICEEGPMACRDIADLIRARK